MWEAEKQATVVEVVVQDPPPTDMPIDRDLSMTGHAAQDVLSDLQSDQQSPTVKEPSTTTEEPEPPTSPEPCAVQNLFQNLLILPWIMSLCLKS